MPKTPSKFDKVVKREVCRITTKGTKTFSFLTGECADSQSTYLLALAEKVGEDSGKRVGTVPSATLRNYAGLQRKHRLVLGVGRMNMGCKKGRECKVY